MNIIILTFEKTALNGLFGARLIKNEDGNPMVFHLESAADDWMDANDCQLGTYSKFVDLDE